MIAANDNNAPANAGAPGVMCGNCAECPFVSGQQQSPNVPFELHVTVRTSNVEEFKCACIDVGVKPLLIQMQSSGGANVLTDLMTSSVVVGSDNDAFIELKRISSCLSIRGFTPTRLKIEAAPWHASTPSNDNGLRLKAGQYFESHLAVECPSGHRNRLAAVGAMASLHVSRNAFKRVGETEIVMATLRKSEGTIEMFKSDLSKARRAVEANGFVVGKEIVEFAIYDSNVNHDASWFAANDNNKQESVSAAA